MGELLPFPHDRQHTKIPTVPLWTGSLAALSVVFFLLARGDVLGQAGLWSDLLVLCAMIVGILIIMISHEGYVAPEVTDDHLPAA
jgi:hypothetical protein